MNAFCASTLRKLNLQEIRLAAHLNTPSTLFLMMAYLCNFLMAMQKPSAITDRNRHLEIDIYIIHPVNENFFMIGSLSAQRGQKRCVLDIQEREGTKEEVHRWDSRKVKMTEVLFPRRITRYITKHMTKRKFC